jgi:hypothetical protein
LKSGISRLLIASAIDADVYRRLMEAAEETFQDFDLTEEEKELIRQPDHRLLRFLGAALAQEGPQTPGPPDSQTVPPQTPGTAGVRTLPDISLVLTLVPCAQYENGELHSFAYAMWVSPLAEGGDPASLGPPPGSLFPGQPLTPMHAVVRVSAMQMQDAAGNPQVGLSASLHQSSNMVATPPGAATGRLSGSPFGNDLGSDDVHAAVAAVRGASSEARYGKLIELMHALRGGKAR